MSAKKQHGLLMEGLKREFVFSMQARKLSPKTIDNYSKQIGFLLRYAKEIYQVDTIESFTSQIIKEFLVSKMKTCKPQYINDLLKAFKVFFRYIHEEGYTSDILTIRIKNVKQPKVKIISFNKKEVKGYLDYFSGRDFLSVRNKTVMAFLFDTGARMAEMANMQPCQIKQDSILIYGKGNKERLVPITPYLGKQLIKYLNARQMFLAGEECECLFPSKNRRMLTEEAVCKFMKDTAKIIDVRKEVRVSPHTCRHTFAHMQLRNGCDLYTLSRLMGHENISITQRYLEGIQDEEIVEKGKKTSPLMNL